MPKAKVIHPVSTPEQVRDAFNHNAMLLNQSIAFQNWCFMSHPMLMKEYLKFQKLLDKMECPEPDLSEGTDVGS